MEYSFYFNSSQVFRKGISHHLAYRCSKNTSYSYNKKVGYPYQSLLENAMLQAICLNAKFYQQFDKCAGQALSSVLQSITRRFDCAVGTSLCFADAWFHRYSKLLPSLRGLDLHERI